MKSTNDHPITLIKCPMTIWFIIATFLLLCLSFHHLQNYETPYTYNKNIIGYIGISRNARQHPVQKPDHCIGRYIYMHDFPPRFNQDLLRHCDKLNKWIDFCPALMNHGFGPKLEKVGESWYNTNQFTLSVIFHQRMKQYECLTNNSLLASAVYAPFYAGLEVGQHLWAKFNPEVTDKAAIDFVTWLSEKPEWIRFNGWDHFFVSGRITSDLRRRPNSNDQWGSCLLNLPEVKNMTVLSIESSPYGNNEFAIPYPTYFHPEEIDEVFEWQETVRKHDRPYLFSFGGAPRPQMKGSIRGELIRQCQKAANNCKLFNCSATGSCDKPSYIIRVFMQSEFCLQPAGDSPTRRSTFDSILAGCIPVFFHPSAAYVQYLWHFPKDYTKYSVFIPEDGVKNGTVDVMNVLSRISKQDVVGMREEVIQMIPRIIYGKKKLIDVDDAFDSTVKMVLKRIEGAKSQIREGVNPNNNFPEVTSWKYYLTGNYTEKHEWDFVIQ